MFRNCVSNKDSWDLSELKAGKTPELEDHHSLGSRKPVHHRLRKSKGSKELRSGPNSFSAKERAPTSHTVRKKAPSSVSSSDSSHFSATGSISSASSIYSSGSSIIRTSDHGSSAALPSFPGTFSHPSIYRNPPKWIYELNKPPATPLSYELPCEFDYLGCSLRFKPEEFEAWIAHSIAHFLGLGPPPKAGCTICTDDEIIFESQRGSDINWRERMFHIGNHLQDCDAVTEIRRDQLVYDYMSKSGIITIECAFQSFPQADRDELFVAHGQASPDERLVNRDVRTNEQHKAQPGLSLPEDYSPPRGECQYLMLGQGETEHMCDCIEFHADIPKPNVCDCGHRKDWHIREEYSPPVYQNPEATDESFFQVATSEIRKGKSREQTSPDESNGEEEEGPGQSCEMLESPTVSRQLSPETRFARIPQRKTLAIRGSPPNISNVLLARVQEEKALLAQNIARVFQTEGLHNEYSPGRRIGGIAPRAGGITRLMSELVSKSSMMSLVTSNGSIDDTDWEEDSDSEIPGKTTCLTRTRGKVQRSNTPFLSPEKRHLVEQLMGEFWQFFNNDRIISCATQNGGSSYMPSADASSSRGITSPPNTNPFRTTKRPRDHQEDEDENGDERQGSKPPGKEHESPDTGDSSLRFACPYRKHNPRKYCIPDWRYCALSPHKSVGRVKAHLYRYHLIHPCPRCKVPLDSDTELEKHLVAFQACEVREVEQIDGITATLKIQIQCRKRAHPNQTEAEKWQQMYRMIFPNETVPDPYFDPVVDHPDNIHQSSGNDIVPSRDEYIRSEVPRRFRTALETAVSAQKHHLEEPLRSQLVAMVEEAQNQAFNSYEEMNNNRSSSKSSAEMSSSIEQESLEDSTREQSHSIDDTQDTLQIFQNRRNVLPDSTMDLETHVRHVLSSDSGYVSNSNSASNSELQILGPSSTAQEQGAEALKSREAAGDITNTSNEPGTFVAPDTTIPSTISGGISQVQQITTQSELSPFDWESYLNVDVEAVAPGAVEHL